MYRKVVGMALADDDMEREWNTAVASGRTKWREKRNDLRKAAADKEPDNRTDAEIAAAWDGITPRFKPQTGRMGDIPRDSATGKFTAPPESTDDEIWNRSQRPRETRTGMRRDARGAVSWSPGER